MRGGRGGAISDGGQGQGAGVSFLLLRCFFLSSQIHGCLLLFLSSLLFIFLFSKLNKLVAEDEVLRAVSLFLTQRVCYYLLLC